MADHKRILESSSMLSNLTGMALRIGDNLVMYSKTSTQLRLNSNHSMMTVMEKKTRAAVVVVNQMMVNVNWILLKSKNWNEIFLWWVMTKMKIMAMKSMINS